MTNNEERLQKIEVQVRELLSKGESKQAETLVEIVRLELLLMKLQRLATSKGWKVMESLLDNEEEIGFLSRSEELVEGVIHPEDIKDVSDLNDMELMDVFASIGLLTMVCEVGFNNFNKKGGN